MKNFKNYFINLICPIFIFGAITGTATALIITLYKYCAKHIIEFSQKGYELLKNHWYFVPLVLIALFGVAFLLSLLYKNNSQTTGGGIPSSITILRRIVSFKWLKTLVGVFVSSLTSFLIGVPLGNEGPSVLMGTAVGKGSVDVLPKKHSVWSKYSMTGGACAGFAIATGAGFSGILFAVEEAHQRVSPAILLVGCISVLFATLTANLISPLLGVSVKLLPQLTLVTMSLKDVWIPIVIGVAMGLFSVLFLKYYHLIAKFVNKNLKKLPLTLKIFIVFAITLGVGLVSFSFVSTGHELIVSLLTQNVGVVFLIIILIIRTTLTLFANTNRITGGIFLPILAIGAVTSAIIANGIKIGFDTNQDYYYVAIALGITASISGMMKMPITAIAFAIETLSCHNNFLYVIIVVAISYVITEIFNAESINDSIINNIVKEKEQKNKRITIHAKLVVQKNSFAESMHVRDILWPSNFVILSMTPTNSNTKTDNFTDEGILKAGDTLEVKYATFNKEETNAELIAILGKQDFEEQTDQQ